MCMSSRSRCKGVCSSCAIVGYPRPDECNLGIVPIRRPRLEGGRRSGELDSTRRREGVRDPIFVILVFTWRSLGCNLEEIVERVLRIGTTYRHCVRLRM